MSKCILLVTGFIFSVLSAFGGQGIYLEFKLSSPSMTGSSKTYVADGNSRSEMTMKNDRMPKPMTIVTMILSSAPGKTYSINEGEKTYTETTAGKVENHDDDYEVTVIGKEKVNNYNCTHVSIRYKQSATTTEMWLSKEIPGYANYTAVKTDYLGGTGFFNKLKEKGAEGFVARILTNGQRGEKMQMDLVKAELQNIPSSVFSLNGYTKNTGMGGYNGMDMQAMQKMTPEERKKYIEQMKAKYKKN